MKGTDAIAKLVVNRITVSAMNITSYAVKGVNAQTAKTRKITYRKKFKFLNNER